MHWMCYEIRGDHVTNSIIATIHFELIISPVSWQVLLWTLIHIYCRTRIAQRFSRQGQTEDKETEGCLWHVHSWAAKPWGRLHILHCPLLVQTLHKPYSLLKVVMLRWAEPQSWRHMVVTVCGLVSHSVRQLFTSPWLLKIKAWNMQCKLNTVLVWNEIGGFRLAALLSSYGMICSPRRLLPAIQSPAENKFTTTST